MQSYDFFVHGTATSSLRVPFARAFKECVCVTLLDAYVQVANATVGVVFLHDYEIERRLFVDRASETTAINALGCVITHAVDSQAARSLPLGVTTSGNDLRRMAKFPFPIDQLDLKFTDADGNAIEVARAALKMRVIHVPGYYP